MDKQLRKSARTALRRIQNEITEMGPGDLDQYASLAARADIDSLNRYARRIRLRRFPERSAEARHALRRLFPKRYTSMLRREALHQRIAPELVLALARQESSFNPRAVSSVGAMGLMQLMPTTARALMREEKNSAQRDTVFFDPATNTRLGTRYLARMVRAFGGRWSYALAAYNAGPGAVTRWRQRRGDLPEDIFVEEIPYRETRDYVQKVLKWVQTYAFAHYVAPVPTPSNELLAGVVPTH